MRRLLTTAAVLAVLVTPVAAADMPKQLQGGWCDSEGSGSYIGMPTTHCPDEPTLKITRSGFEWPDEGSTCKPVKVRKTSKRDWPAANWIVAARCTNNAPTVTTFEFNWWRGSLEVIEAGHD
jgi:hypothetical protein